MEWQPRVVWMVYCSCPWGPKSGRMSTKPKPKPRHPMCWWAQEGLWGPQTVLTLCILYFFFYIILWTLQNAKNLHGWIYIKTNIFTTSLKILKYLNSYLLGSTCNTIWRYFSRCKKRSSFNRCYMYIFKIHYLYFSLIYLYLYILI